MAKIVQGRQSYAPHIVRIDDKLSDITIAGRAMNVAAGADNDSVAALALADPNVQKFVGDKEIRKTIVVPGRLVNIVV